MAENDSRHGSRALAELCDRKTYEAIGPAIYLFGFLRSDQFHRRNPVTYDWLAGQTGFNARTLEHWLRKLRRAGFAKVESGWNGLHISLRTRFGAAVVDGDFELIDTRGWQRPLDSDNVESALYGHVAGGNEIVRAFQDADPQFVVEDADGDRARERLRDSNPPALDPRMIVRRPLARAAAGAD